PVEVCTKLVEPFLRPDPPPVRALGRVHERLAALDRLHSFEARVSWWARVEDDAAADGGPRAKDDAVSARGHDRVREPKLRKAVAGERYARGHVGGPVMHVHARRDVRKALPRDVEAI